MLSTRIRVLNDKLDDASGRYVLYWMQQSQRVNFNHALEAAIAKANQLKLPVVVGFGLMDDYPEATERHYAFMIDGLRDVKEDLEKRDILFVVKHGIPADVAIEMSRHAAVVVTDRGYLRHLRRWRDRVADSVHCKVVEVETDVVVPVDVVSTKSEFAARTIRPKIHKLWDQYLAPLAKTTVKESSLGMKIKSDFDVSKPEAMLAKIQCDRSVKKSKQFKGGSHAAQALLDDFIKSKLNGYAEGRNEPADGQTSLMAPYLQYGHISPIDLSLRVKAAKVAGDADRDSYIEELIIRRELSHNFCTYCPNYDSFDCLPDWCKKTLAAHEKDARQYIYARDQLEQAKTHDSYWNAAQLEMVRTGYMHNYMRMYWGKKILEWSKTPQEAYATTIYLNNRYLLDGLNANTYGNIGWIYGLHDRPWTERPIFGTVRYMNAAGLERKFDMDRYLSKVAMLD